MVDASDRLQRLRSPSTSVTVTASSGVNRASLLSPQFNLFAVDGSNGREAIAFREDSLAMVHITSTRGSTRTGTAKPYLIQTTNN